MKVLLTSNNGEEFNPVPATPHPIMTSLPLEADLPLYLAFDMELHSRDNLHKSSPLRQKVLLNKTWYWYFQNMSPLKLNLNESLQWAGCDKK